MIRLLALNPNDLAELPHEFRVVPELIAGCEVHSLALGRKATVVWWGTPGAPLLNTLVNETPEQIEAAVMRFEAARFEKAMAQQEIHQARIRASETD